MSNNKRIKLNLKKLLEQYSDANSFEITIPINKPGNIKIKPINK